MSMFEECNGSLETTRYFGITAISFELGPSCMKSIFFILKQINLHKIILTGRNFLSSSIAFITYSDLIQSFASVVTVLGYFLKF